MIKNKIYIWHKQFGLVFIESPCSLTPPLFALWKYQSQAFVKEEEEGEISHLRYEAVS